MKGMKVIKECEVESCSCWWADEESCWRKEAVENYAQAGPGQEGETSRFVRYNLP